MTRKHRSPAAQAASRTTAVVSAAPWHLQWARWLILGVLILVPLVFLSPDAKLPNPTDMPRRLVLALGAGLLLAAIVQGWAAGGRLRWRRHVLDLAVGLWLLAAIIAGACGAYPQLSLGFPLWLQDFTTLPVLLIGVALYVGVKDALRELKDIEGAAFVMALVGGVEALIGLFDHFGHLGLHPKFSGERLLGTLGNPMFAGTFFAMLIPLAICLAFSSPRRSRQILLLASAALMAFALLLTSTRGAWLGLAVTLVLLALLALWRMRVERKAVSPAVLAGAGALLALVLASGLLLPQVRQRFANIFNAKDGTVQTRLVYMTSAWNMFRARPLTGWGPGVMRAVSPQFRLSSMAQENGIPLNRGYSASLPHNLPLQVAAEMGIIGLLPFVLLIILLVYAGLRLVAAPAAPGWLAIGLLGMLAANLLCNLAAFDNSATLGYFWVGLGLLAALGAKERPIFAQVSPPAKLLHAVAAVLAVAVVLFVLAQTLGTYYLQRGIDGTDVKALSGLEQAERYHRVNDAILDLRTALTYVPAHDYVAYGALTVAYYVQSTAASSEQQALAARTAMFNTGQQTLRYFDRDEQTRRLLFHEYLNDRRFPETLAQCQQLIKNEPHSSEVYVLYATLLQEQNKLPDALKELDAADKLDTTNGDIPVLRAHMLLGLNTAKLNAETDPRHDPLLQRISAYYQHSLELLGDIAPEYRQEYATVLFLQGKTEEAITQGQTIPDPQRQLALSQLITALGQKYNRTADANRAAKAITTQPTASAPAAPALDLPTGMKQP